MSAFRALSHDEWQAHPLNRIRGGMAWVLGWIGFQTALALLLIGLLIFVPFELFDPSIPDGFEWGQWIVLVLGPPVVFVLLLRRAPVGRWVYALYIATVLGFSFYAERWSPFLTDVASYQSLLAFVGVGVFLAFTLADILALRFLFFSNRANIVLRRRERIVP